MQDGQPSKTAFGVARRRAAHQVLDQQPLVLPDPVAVPILGPQTATTIRAEAEKLNSPFALAMRSFMVARSRYAEDQLRAAIAAGPASTGIDQYVVLGAGLDTYAYRNRYDHLKVFEVDHPATQEWKRYLLAQAVIEIPPSLSFVPVDFEKQTLTDALAQTTFDFAKPAFFSWLGVTPYLTLEAFRATIHAIAAMPQGSGVTFEYTVDRSLLSFREKMAFDVIAERVAQAGEPFQLFFSPDAMEQELRGAGFTRTEELTSDDINERYFRDRRDGLKLQGNVARLITAWV
jgi:methyltransferase (TIGR00027 family)